jgi:N-acetylmuramoyl-L-alanine amidase
VLQLEKASKAWSGNHGGVRRATKYLIIHYTAGDSAEGAIAWLRNPASHASAHIVIGQGGAVTQLVELDRVAWHAGASAWGSDHQLNLLSIGIELVNPGPLSRIRPGAYASGKRTRGEDEVVHAPALGGGSVRAWAKYPEAQLASLEAVVAVLRGLYKFEATLGHDQIAVPAGRKQDPGPAFPWDRFR